MPSIGNIVVKRIIEHKLLPPVSIPIIKGPTFPVVIAPEIVSPPYGIILPGGKGALPGGIKSVIRGITQSVVVGAGSVTRVKVSGVVGISYTQLDYTSLSYTLLGAQVSKALSQTITISEPLAVRRVKGRSIFEDSPELTELSFSLNNERTKTRALAVQSNVIADLVESVVTTGVFKSLTESTTVSDSVAAQTTKTRALATQTVPIDESLVMVLEETESYTGDSYTNLSYVVGISETRSLTETVAISDLLEGLVTYAIGQHKTRALTENISISEGVIATRTTKARLVTETVPITEAIIKVITLTRTSFSATRFTITGYTARLRNVKTLNEVVEESHTVRMALTKKRTIADTVIISEDLTITVPPPTGDNVLVTDQVTRTVGKDRGLSQSVTIIG